MLLCYTALLSRARRSSLTRRTCVSSRLSKQLASAQDTAKRVALHQQYGPKAPPNAAKLYDAEAVRDQRASVSKCSLLTDSLTCIQRSAMLNLWQILRRCSAS
jgi:hypothetical protein